MRRYAICGLLLLAAGCQNVRGPFQPRSPQRVDDPRLPIPEQQMRGRDQLPLPDESYTAGPNDAAARYGVPAYR